MGRGDEEMGRWGCLLERQKKRKLIMGYGCDRADDKMASEYNLEGGATLHLVLALRGGF